MQLKAHLNILLSLPPEDQLQLRPKCRLRFRCQSGNSKMPETDEKSEFQVLMSFKLT